MTSLPVGVSRTDGFLSLVPRSRTSTTSTEFDYPIRFSIRKELSIPWSTNPVKPQEIRSGDTVHLFCHSLGLGPFTNPDHPPSFANPAFARKLADYTELVFGTLPNLSKFIVPEELVSYFAVLKEWRTRELAKSWASYDARQMRADDQDLCEAMGMVPDLSWIRNQKKDYVNWRRSEDGMLAGIKQRLDECFANAAGSFTVVDGKKTPIELPDLKSCQPFRSKEWEWIDTFSCFTELACCAPVANLTVVFE